MNRSSSSSSSSKETEEGDDLFEGVGLDKVTSFDSATSDLVVASEDSGLHFLLLSAPCLTTVTAGSEGSLFDGGVDLARRLLLKNQQE